jgi:hypothetical protein
MNPYKTWTGPMKLKSIVDSLKTLCHVCLWYRYIRKRDPASSIIMKQLTAEPFLFSDACSVPSFTHIECSRIHISPFQMMWWDSSGWAVSTLCFWIINHFKVCSPNLETKLVEEHFLDNPHFFAWQFNTTLACRKRTHYGLVIRASPDKAPSQFHTVAVAASRRPAWLPVTLPAHM